MQGHNDDDWTSNHAVRYLRLAQRMVHADRAGAIRQLRLSAELAGMLEAFTLAQLRKFAASNFALCSFRLIELPIAALGGAPESGDCAHPADNARTPRAPRPRPSSRHPGHVWAGHFLRGFAVAGLVVQAAALAMALAPSIAAHCQRLASLGGAIMGLLAAGAIWCWWRAA